MRAPPAFCNTVARCDEQPNRPGSDLQAGRELRRAGSNMRWSTETGRWRAGNKACMMFAYALWKTEWLLLITGVLLIATQYVFSQSSPPVEQLVSELPPCSVLRAE